MIINLYIWKHSISEEVIREYHLNTWERSGNCALFSPALRTNPRAFFVQSLKGAMAFTLTSLLFFCLNNGTLTFLKETEPKEDEETHFKDWLILSCKLGLQDSQGKPTW